MKVGINGFGRMGRLATRALWDHPGLELVAINEPHADAETLAILLEFDSVQGRWQHGVRAAGDAIAVADREIGLTRETAATTLDWRDTGVQLVLECSGKLRTLDALTPHFDRGAARVLVSAPVKGGPPNVVIGVNDGDVDFAEAKIVSAASCTTNCLAPIVKVVHDAFGIERGCVTTIHDPTNTQRVVDAPHKDPRRARAAQLNLIPTSTNSAHAVTAILPALQGKLDSLAVRAPVLNASLVDAALHLSREATAEEINAALRRASETEPLRGILGYETRPLVSSDFRGDPRSGIVDAASTRVVDGRLAKILAWYDNEWGYANRLAELAARIAAATEATRA